MEQLKILGSSILKEQQIDDLSPDMSEPHIRKNQPGNIVHCIISSTGYCRVTKNSTSDGKEWYLNALTTEQDKKQAQQQLQADMRKAEANIRKQGRELFMNGCLSSGFIGAGCQAYFVFGGKDPFTGKPLTKDERILMGAGFAVQTAGVYANIASRKAIPFNPNIEQHMSKYDGFTQKRGISGTHNQLEFNKAVELHDIKILSQESTSTAGIYNIKYQIPAKDRAGNIVGYKANIFQKTVYNPNIFSDDVMFNYGKQAAKNSYHFAISNKKTQYNSRFKGVNFRIYIDPKTGNISNFHPQ